MSWEEKYKIMYEFVKKHKRIPHLKELIFADGKNGYKWYRTQMYVMKKTNKTPMEVLRSKKVEQLNVFIISQQTNQPNLSVKEKLKELYECAVELKRFPYAQEKYFTDKKNIGEFIKKIQSGKIFLSPQEKELFYKILKFIIQLKYAGTWGVIKYKNKKYTVRTYKKEKRENRPIITASHLEQKIKQKPILGLHSMTFTSHLKYLKKRYAISSHDLAELFCISKNAYRHIELESYIFSFYHKMQLIEYIERQEEDATIKEFYTKLKETIKFQDEINYFLIKISVLFSFYKDNNHKRASSFSKKYAVTKNIIPTKKYNLAKKIEIYKELREILSEEELLVKEIHILQDFLELLKKEILKEVSKEEVLNQTCIALDVKCKNYPSIYTLSEEEAAYIMNQLDYIKLSRNLSGDQKEYVFLCEELLSCILNPGKDLCFEIIRLQQILGITQEEFAQTIDIQRKCLSRQLVNKKIRIHSKKQIEIHYHKFLKYGNKEAVKRLETCFSEKDISLKRNKIM